MITPALLLAALVAVSTGCSNKSVYEAIQDSNAQECQKNQPSARERCMERVGEPYEDYEKSRQELLENEP